MSPWKRVQYRRLLALLDYADKLPDRDRRVLGTRLIQITDAVDALAGKKTGINHRHISSVIEELEHKHLTLA